MLRLLLFNYHIALCTRCIALLLVSHTCAFFDRSRGGPQASSGENTNLALDQDKPRCIPPKSLSFMFETLFILL
jgi:hypothetical protein